LALTLDELSVAWLHFHPLVAFKACQHLVSTVSVCLTHRSSGKD